MMTENRKIAAICENPSLRRRWRRLSAEERRASLERIETGTDAEIRAALWGKKTRGKGRVTSDEEQDAK